MNKTTLHIGASLFLVVSLTLLVQATELSRPTEAQGMLRSIKEQLIESPPVVDLLREQMVKDAAIRHKDAADKHAAKADESGTTAEKVVDIALKLTQDANTSGTQANNAHAAALKAKAEVESVKKESNVLKTKAADLISALDPSKTGEAESISAIKDTLRALIEQLKKSQAAALQAKSATIDVGKEANLLANDDLKLTVKALIDQIEKTIDGLVAAVKDAEESTISQVLAGNHVYQRLVFTMKEFELARIRRFEAGDNRASSEVEKYDNVEADFNRLYAEYSVWVLTNTPPTSVGKVFKSYRDVLIATKSGTDFMAKAREVGRPVFQTRQEERVAVIKYENWVSSGSAFVRQDGSKKVYYSVQVQRPVLSSGTHYVGEANAPMYVKSELMPTKISSLKRNVTIPIYREFSDDYEELKNGRVKEKLSNGNWLDTVEQNEDKLCYRGIVVFGSSDNAKSQRIVGFHYVPSTDRNLRPTKACVVVLPKDYNSEDVPSTNIGQFVKLPESHGIVLLSKPAVGNRVFVFFEKEISLNQMLNHADALDKDFVLPELCLIKTTKDPLAVGSPE